MSSKNVFSSTLAIVIFIVCIDQGEILTHFLSVSCGIVFTRILFIDCRLGHKMLEL